MVCVCQSVDPPHCTDCHCPPTRRPETDLSFFYEHKPDSLSRRGIGTVYYYSPFPSVTETLTEEKNNGFAMSESLQQRKRKDNKISSRKGASLWSVAVHVDAIFMIYAAAAAARGRLTEVSFVSSQRRHYLRTISPGRKLTISIVQ